MEQIHPVGGVLVLDRPGARLENAVVFGTVWITAPGVQLHRVLVSPRPGRRTGVRIGPGAHGEISNSWLIGDECELDAVWMESGAHGAVLRSVGIRGWGTHVRAQSGTLLADCLVSCGQSALAGRLDALIEVSSDRHCRIEHSLLDAHRPDGSVSPAPVIQLSPLDRQIPDLVVEDTDLSGAEIGFAWTTSGGLLRVRSVQVDSAMQLSDPGSELRDLSAWDVAVQEAAPAAVHGAAHGAGAVMPDRTLRSAGDDQAGTI